ncbi:hypothetical protein G3R49_12290 [Shewanella sp. WXL01]|uniref:hypothetical protein n=1 Tax=Shewanella sp. WXL01 TaxID=2709721 RepID=UPI0014382F76|nr:hypothetical protein [Shewanella sp. WXL01]NKF51336.1 hypothetical protein [Shewanella sp. WXL01]
MTELEWLETCGLEKVDIKLKCFDHKGNETWVIPDALMVGENAKGESEVIYIEYKNGLKLSTDGRNKGKPAAEKKKEDYINNQWLSPARAKKAATMGWNHSIYKFISMKQCWEKETLNVEKDETKLSDLETGAPVTNFRVIVVDPKMNRHKNDPTYQRDVLSKGTNAGVEFMTDLEVEQELEGYLQMN